MGRFCRICIFIRQELSLHFVSVHVGQVVEDVLSEVGAYLLGLLVASVVLWCLVEAIVAPQRLPLSFRILLK